MTINQIKEKVNSIEGLGGMTVNERLYLCGVMELFDKAMKNDIEFAKLILSELKIDNKSIEKIMIDQSLLENE